MFTSWFVPDPPKHFFQTFFPMMPGRLTLQQSSALPLLTGSEKEFEILEGNWEILKTFLGLAVPLIWVELGRRGMVRKLKILTCYLGIEQLNSLTFHWFLQNCFREIYWWLRVDFRTSSSAMNPDVGARESLGKWEISWFLLGANLWYFTPGSFWILRSTSEWSVLGLWFG